MNNQDENKAPSIKKNEDASKSREDLISLIMSSGCKNEQWKQESSSEKYNIHIYIYKRHKGWIGNWLLEVREIKNGKMQRAK